MAVEQIDIEKFLQLSQECFVFDVRSPEEYLHAHIPQAKSLPLFTDEQRKIIGTAYKQQSRQVAVKKGLEFFSERMRIIPPEVEEIINVNKGKNNNKVLVHCWRGGMRSGAVGWLLDLYGFKVYTLKGGYKSFRKWALDQFTKEYKIKILGGFTGSGKTDVLNEMHRKGKSVIDLENLANHKGSAFGSLGERAQPGQELFENLLALELFKNKKNDQGKDEIWMEDESRHIGSLGLPGTLWDQMRKSPVYFLEIPFKERLEYIVSTYGKFDKKMLVTSIMKIQKKLGGLETKNAINFLLEDNIEESFSILLRYYDKQYNNSLQKRENIEEVLNKIPCKTVDINNGKIFFSGEVRADD